MAKPLTTHREILRGLLLAVPIAMVLVCIVWFVAVGTAPTATVWVLRDGSVRIPGVGRYRVDQRADRASEAADRAV